uniref:uncharacterized protein LOC120347908 n=1 Tax=Styela clava TaxID=7725 RepID=UPI00193A3EEA|nr:uncharacterized protein LOC120347908 [Styela clava]
MFLKESIDNMKERLTDETEIYAKNIKKLRNRQSAQRARDRQKARLRWLEREVAILTVKNQALQAENVALRNLIDNDKPQPRIQEPIRRKDTLPIKKRVQAQSAGGKSFNPDVDNIQSSPRKRPNSDFVPGRIQGKLKIINSENDKPFTVVDRVAVISPVLRNESCESDRPSQPAFISPDPTKGLKVSTRHNQNINQPSKDGQHLKNHLATNFVADYVKSDQDMRPINYSTAKKDLAFQMVC